MKLVVIGDSWAAGYIADSDKPDLPECYEYSFANHLPTMCKTITSVENLSCRGRSQQYISWRLHRYMTWNDVSNTAFLFVFSNAWRIGMPYKEYSYEQHPIFYPYKTEHEIGKDNHWQAEHENEIHKHGIEALCQKMGVKFACIDAFENTAQTSLVKTQSANYINANKPNNTLADMVLGRYGKPGDTPAVELLQQFVAYSPLIAPCLHPSVQGHKYIAYKLKDLLDAKFS